MAQNFRKFASVTKRAQVKPHGLPVPQIEAAARLAHGGGVDHGRQVVDVVDEDLVKKGLVGGLNLFEDVVAVDGAQIGGGKLAENPAKARAIAGENFSHHRLSVQQLVMIRGGAESMTMTGVQCKAPVNYARWDFWSLIFVRREM